MIIKKFYSFYVIIITIFTIIGCSIDEDKFYSIIKIGTEYQNIKKILESYPNDISLGDGNDACEFNTPEDYQENVLVIKFKNSQDVLYLVMIKKENEPENKYKVYTMFWYYNWYDDAVKPKVKRKYNTKNVNFVNIEKVLTMNTNSPKK
ncbi:hypothetical protein AAEX28_12205 [Lentisphaerota bacterium WC36G]|nr:hypothetical protein LJT99_15035 [Lentisphaerae bacterium WC36]